MRELIVTCQNDTVQSDLISFLGDAISVEGELYIIVPLENNDIVLLCSVLTYLHASSYIMEVNLEVDGEKVYNLNDVLLLARKD